MNYLELNGKMKATKSAMAVKTFAYTVGKNVLFVERQYSPQITARECLVANELAHVAKQNFNDLILGNIALHQYNKVTGLPGGQSCVHMDGPNTRRVYGYSNGRFKNVRIYGQAVPVSYEEDRKCSSPDNKRGKLEGSGNQWESRLSIIKRPVVPGLEGVVT